MPIRDRDGNVYTFTKPNPVMKTQDRWDRDNLILHNFHFPDISGVEGRRGYIPSPPDLKELDPEPLPVERNVAVMEPARPQTPEPAPVPEPPVERPRPTADPAVASRLEKMKIVFHCLPAQRNTITDDLYGEVSTRVVFGPKFKFPGIVVENTDLTLVFWTDRSVAEGSIVYPQMKTKRWWKINKAVEKSGGYICSCISSDINPDFSG